jgi:hypothetical protein
MVRQAQDFSKCWSVDKLKAEVLQLRAAQTGQSTTAWTPGANWVTSVQAWHNNLATKRAESVHQSTWTPLRSSSWSANGSRHILSHFFDKACMLEMGVGHWADKILSTYKDKSVQNHQPGRDTVLAQHAGHCSSWEGARRVVATPKHCMSTTIVAAGNAEGEVLAPNYIYQGTYLTHSVLGATKHYSGSAVLASPASHMMTGAIFPLYLKQLKRQIPGGVSPSNRVLLIVDGHASRKSTETAAAAKAMGFDIPIMPPRCTNFSQPRDQVFGSFKAALRHLTGSARTKAAGRDGSYNATRAELFSLADYAMHMSVGAGDGKLQRAITKTGMWPPCSAAAITAADKTTTAAGEASLGGSKHPAPKRRHVDVWEQHEAVRRAQQPPTACHLLADTYLTKGGITKLTVAAYRKAKSSRRARLDARQPSRPRRARMTMWLDTVDIRPHGMPGLVFRDY